MKKLLCLVTISSLLVATAMAQPGLHLGIKGGANMTKIDGEQYKDAFDFNYHLGGFLQLDLTKGFGIQPEVIFSQSTSRTGTRFSDIYTEFPNSNDQKIKLNYLSIPVLANIKFSNALWLQLGPQYSILMNDHESLTQNGKDAFKKGDLSGVGGLWLKLPLGLSLSARYVIGLSNLNDVSDENKWNSQAIQLGIGFTFF
ncbi:MAG TPA: porin family protein [Chitinophagaceae bacterium]|nr:porin family protein [Chitinophagaceae bacterium]